MPHLYRKFKEWGIKKVVICSSFNKMGYLMSPGVKIYVANNNPADYQLVAMLTSVSGTISFEEVNEFINGQQMQAVMFGTSERKHIEEMVELIHIK
jgi:hypothetical protein